MRVLCVGAIVRDERGRLLMIRRGRPPGEGLWSIPGGRVEPGESDAQAVARELLEETGLTVSVGGLAGTVERPGPDGVTFLIRDYAATAVAGTLRAGDDAAEARWVPLAELDALPVTPGLLEALREWGMLPRVPSRSAEAP
ncbi:NUDIX hydrolase [Actinomadura gamaensis]|uniref:NUDIX hydrolase n=1 Tax=Actinomadura gamaensis TaxID=1763541 RepID=A0ABV9TNZ5_9ACTN